MALVFSKGEWITVPLPSDQWSFSDQLLFANVYAYATRERNVPAAEATVIAEAVVFKRLYPGTTMNQDLEKLVSWLQFGI
jgi:hypothetical protein